MLKKKLLKIVKTSLCLSLLSIMIVVITSFTNVHNGELGKLTKATTEPIFKNVVYTGNDDIYKNNGYLVFLISL